MKLDSNHYMNKRIAIFGSLFGVEQLIKFIPKDNICCIVAPTNRPQDYRPLEVLSNKMSIPLLKHVSVKNNHYAQLVHDLTFYKPDIIISNAYSMILRRDILNIARDAINIHWALLPKNRGANPIQWSIIKGESRTGVTIHSMNESIDCGAIIAQKGLDILFDETWVDVFARLVKLSSNLLKEMCPKILHEEYTRTIQNEDESSSNIRLNEESPQIIFEEMSDLEIYNLIRAQVAPLKGAFVILDDGNKKFFPDFVPYENIKNLRDQYA